MQVPSSRTPDHLEGITPTELKTTFKLYPHSQQISLHDLIEASFQDSSPGPPSRLPLAMSILQMPSDHNEENGHIVADEVTPLLANSSTTPARPQWDASPLSPKPSATSNREEDEEEKPLPKLQIFFLCFARLVDPISFFCIFPFVNQMIYETGNVNEEDVGFYSGLIVVAPFPISLAQLTAFSRNLCSQ